MNVLVPNIPELSWKIQNKTRIIFYTLLYLHRPVCRKCRRFRQHQTPTRSYVSETTTIQTQSTELQQ